MKNIFRLSIIILFSIILYSCSNKDLSELKLIPKDASMVVVLDNEQLKSKLDKANIDLDSVFNKIFSYDSSKHKDVKEKFTDLRNNAGIDWNKKVIVFIEPKSYGSKGNATTINLIAHVKDSAKFLKYLLKQDEVRGRDVITEKNYSYISFDYKGMVSWTDKLAVLTFFNYQEGSVNNDKPLINVDEQEGINKTDEIKKEVARFYSLKEDESIASLGIMTDLMKKKADISTFHSTSSIQAWLTHMPISLPKLPELLQDNYSTSTFNFDDGKITTSSAIYPNKTIAAILKTYPGSSVNLSMLENYPSNDIDVAFLANFNPQVIDALLKELEVESLGDTFLSKIGLKTGDLYKMFKGDVSFTLSDFSWKATDSSLSKTKPSLKYLFNATVGDKEVLHKLLDKGIELGFVVKDNNSYKLKNEFNKLGLFINIDDKNIIVASDEDVYKKYISQIFKANINSEVINKMKDKTSATYVDLEKIFGTISTSSKNNDSTFIKLRDNFKDIISTAEKFDGTKIESHTEIHLKATNENSLTTLLKLIMHIAPGLKNSQTVEDFRELPLIKNII